MIGYTTLGTNDIAKAAAFYDALFAEVGATRLLDMDNLVGWGTGMDRPMVAVIKPYDGNPATVGNGVMVALVVGKLGAGGPAARQGAGTRRRQRRRPRAARRRLLRRLLPRHGRPQAQLRLHDRWLKVGCGSGANASLPLVARRALSTLASAPAARSRIESRRTAAPREAASSCQWTQERNHVLHLRLQLGNMFPYSATSRKLRKEITRRGE